MGKPSVLNKPQYVFRPRQVLRRLSGVRRRWAPDETFLAELPWGSMIECWPSDTIGSSILRLGLYDLLATEALFRLADPGERAADVGANIGHMTNVLATAAGPDGHVLSFEAQPAVFALLARNARRWNGQEPLAPIETYDVAVSRRVGMATMATPPSFHANRGTSRLVDQGTIEHDERRHEVETTRLDAVISDPIGVLKLDVEGHELAVLDGAEGLLSAAAIRDVLFEEMARYPTEVTRRLEDSGFEIFALHQRLGGPQLVPPGSTAEDGSWDPPVFLATIDGPRLRARFERRGWEALRHSQHRRA